MVEREINKVQNLGNRIIDEVGKIIVGKKRLLRLILSSVLSGGHVLLEDFPGLGKTMIAKSLAEVLGLQFKRIQFTTDLLPSDITGGYIYDRETGKFLLRKGPLFANIILADEINRTSPKTQSALLEAMQERQVTLEGETLNLPDPFVVIGTQNPIEYEGTFPLPEAQLDRFLIKADVGYPTKEEEIKMLELRHQRKQDEFTLDQISSVDEILNIRQLIENVYISPKIEDYIVSLVDATRIHSMVAVGASPRGSLALLKLTRAWAALEGRTHVLPDDVKAMIRPALIHRLILKPDYWLNQTAALDVIKEVLRSIQVPVLEE